MGFPFTVSMELYYINTGSDREGNAMSRFWILDFVILAREARD
jgi:hypothetical protein